MRNLNEDVATAQENDDEILKPIRTRSPPPILTPALTPNLDAHESDPLHLAQSHGDDGQSQVEQPDPELVKVLPIVTCEVRARIPTTVGQEMFLHLYHNNVDNKEHLAIVFGPHIRSKSLDAMRPGETEKDRMIRGAYSGRLFPGRTDSRPVQTKDKTDFVKSSAQETGQAQKQQGTEHATAEVTREVPHRTAPLVRIHSECYTGETVWSARCDCGEQLDEAARLMSIVDTISPDTKVSLSEQAPPHLSPAGGVIIYLRQEGRGIGLLSKLKAYNLQDLGHDTMQANLLLRHPADARSYGLATAMLLDLGLGGDRGIRLLTNNPEKVRAVEGPHREVRVVERVPMIPLAWKSGGSQGVQGPDIDRYISTKIEKFKHIFTT